MAHAPIWTILDQLVLIQQGNMSSKKLAKPPHRPLAQEDPERHQHRADEAPRKGRSGKPGDPCKLYRKIDRNGHRNEDDHSAATIVLPSLSRLPVAAEYENFTSYPSEQHYFVNKCRSDHVRGIRLGERSIITRP